MVICFFYKFKNNDFLKPPFPLTFRPGEAPFVELTPELKRWIKTNNVDVLFHFGGKSWDMITLEMQQDYTGQPTEWAATKPEMAIEIFARKDAGHLVRSEVPASVFGNGYRDGWNTVEAFRTRDDIIGIYQMRGIDDLSGRGVQIRYKLVQNENAKTVSAQPTLPTSAFQIRLVADDSETNVPTDTLTNYFDGTHIERLRLVKDILMDGKAVESAGWHAADGRTNFLIGLTDDPAFDPVANGYLSASQVIIRPKAGHLTAVVVTGAGSKPGQAVSVEVTLRLAGKSFKCGSLMSWKSADGTTSSSSGGELKADLDSLDPQIKEAEIVMTPNPQAVESRAGIDRIWGKDIVFSHVPLTRQDLPRVHPDNYQFVPGKFPQLRAPWIRSSQRSGPEAASFI